MRNNEIQLILVAPQFSGVAAGLHGVMLATPFADGLEGFSRLWRAARLSHVAYGDR